MDKAASEKSSGAYRTISEVAAELDLPQHVLRFWETRFPQVRPLKRAGGRRFYRPADVALLRTIRVLLYRDGYTIKGVQRLLRERNARDRADAGDDADPFGRPDASESAASVSAAAADPAVEEGDDGLINGGSRNSEEAFSGGDGHALATRPASAAPEPGPAVVAASPAGGDPSRQVDLGALREALALIEECERLLGAALAPGP